MTKWLAAFGGACARAGCLLVATILAGCSSSSDLMQVQNNQFELRGMVANDRQQIESLREQLSGLSDRISEIEHNSSGGQGETSPAALQQRVSKLEQQMATAPPANVGANPLGTVSPGSTEAGGLASGEAGAAGGEEAASAAPPAAPIVPPEGGGAASWRNALDHELTATHNDAGAKLYRAGLTDMKAGRYSQAVAKFQDLQRRYPKSDLSEAAEYFSANGLYESGKYDQSILQFNDLTMRFPRGRFATAALLREAEAFIKINDRIDARLTLQKLLNDHPDSPEAPSAKSMMQTLAS
jgi:tol-pal system protein YbgF